MREITIPLSEGRSSVIRIGSGLLDSAPEYFHRAGLRGRFFVVHDEAVAPYANRIACAVVEAGDSAVTVEVPSGERSKSPDGIVRLWEQMAGARLDRRSIVVAVGGGVVGDLAGFAAATYLRGLPFAQVPTTLLAQVDASVGGKTGIDLPAGKNLVGAFHQPACVLVDPTTLGTLPAREYRSGLAEVIKYGVIADPCLLDYLTAEREAVLRRDPDALMHLVARSCEIKAEVVAGDERESGRREILNYGHTVGHAIEVVAGYGVYAHGEAVAIGMTAAGRLSSRCSTLSEADRDRVERTLALYGLPTMLRGPLAASDLLQAMRGDKKNRDGQIRFVLARTLGSVCVEPVAEDLILPLLTAVM